MSFFKFLLSKTFLINLVIAIIVTTSLYFILIYSLNSYTHHGEGVIVPDFTNLTYKDAKELAQQSHLKVLISDTTYSQETARGLIAAQIPTMESIIKSERTIYLTINSLNAEMVNMPNFVGASLRQALVDAEIYGLKIGEISYKPNLAKNYVLEQKINGKMISEGTQVEKGSFIDLTLGMGLSNEKVFIPLLLNKNIQEADSMLRAKYLNTGAKFYDSNIKTASDSNAAIIYNQEPKPFDNNFKPGDFVDLWFTLDSSKVVIKKEWVDSLKIKSTSDTIHSLID